MFFECIGLLESEICKTIKCKNTIIIIINGKIKWNEKIDLK